MESSKRAPNFTKTEVDKLVSAVRSRIRIIVESFGPNVSKNMKQTAWKEVADAVNAVSPYIRTVTELKKKYQSLKSEGKITEAENWKEIRRTGGGEANLKELDHNGMIPTCAISGVIGGVDVLDESELHNEINNYEHPDILEGVQSLENEPGTSKKNTTNLDKREILGMAFLANKKEEVAKTTSDSSEGRIALNKTTYLKCNSGNVNMSNIPIKKARINQPESNLMVLQRMQVNLLREHGSELKRIGNALEARNAIEQKKLDLKIEKLDLKKNLLSVSGR